MTEADTRPQHPEGLTSRQERIAFGLFDTRVVRFGQFRGKTHDVYPNAPPLPIYFNVSDIQRYPSFWSDAVAEYQTVLDSITTEYDIIGPVLQGGSLFAYPLASVTGKPTVTARLTEKTHGAEGQLEGYHPDDAGKRVIMLDDVATSGLSILQAIKIVRDHGLLVPFGLVLVDREQGARERLQEEGITLLSVMKLGQLLNLFTRTGKIGKEQQKEIQQGLEDFNNYFKQ